MNANSIRIKTQIFHKIKHDFKCLERSHKVTVMFWTFLTNYKINNRS